MTRFLKINERTRIAKAKRDAALARIELREPSTPRVAAAGPTSFPLKVTDQETERMIEDFLRSRRIG